MSFAAGLAPASIASEQPMHKARCPKIATCKKKQHPLGAAFLTSANLLDSGQVFNRGTG